MQREDLTTGDKAAVFIANAISAAHLFPHVEIIRAAIYELTAPPRSALRGLRDLQVRQGTPDDLPRLVGLGEEGDNQRDELERRFARGDLCYLGLRGDRVLCQSWFHRGPRPFEEDSPRLALWNLDAQSYWSYAALAAIEARASGIFVKVFHTALTELFKLHGARRVICRVRADNQPSRLLHDRMGFHRLGTLTALLTPVGRVLRYRGAGGAAQWLVPTGGLLSLPMPPTPPPPMGWETT